MSDTIRTEDVPSTANKGTGAGGANTNYYGKKFEDLDFSVEDIESVKVAISEACTNSVQHAYKDGDGHIEITCFLSDKKLEITVKDEGAGFDVGILGTQSQIEKSEEKLGLGLGITFIKNLMDEATVYSVPGKSTEIHMVKSRK